MQGVRNRGRRSVLLGLIAGVCAFALPASAAHAEPWPCDGAGYVTQFDGTNPAAGTSFNRADRQPDDTYQLTELGNPATHLNAVAFRPQDGFMYGFDNTLGQIVRIERDGSGNATFTPIGLPAGSGITITVVGAVLADGTYFVWQNEADPTPGHGAIFDVSGPTAQLVTTVTSGGGANLNGDYAVNPIDGELYGVNPDNPADQTDTWGLYRFTLSGATLTREERVADAASAGAGFFQPDGTYIMYVNGTVPEPATPPEGAGLYSVDLTTGERTFLGSGPILSNVDGTGCANGLAVSKDAAPRTVVQGGVVTYIHTITSRALVDSPVDFSDQLPAGMKYVPGGVTMNPSSFGTPNNYGNTRNLSISGSLAPEETVTIRARVRVGRNAACDTDVENQSQAGLVVEGLPPVTVDSDDPTTAEDPQDPTVVHTICAPPKGKPKLVLKKQTGKGTVRPGEVVPYKITVRNKGESVAKRVKVCDTLPSGLELLKARGAKSSDRKACWTLKRLGAGKKKTLKVVAQVKTSAGEGSLTNRATAKGENTKRTKAKEKVKVETAQDPCAVGRIAARC